MNKKLYRSRKEKMLSGVAGGIAEYFDLDPTLVRILFIVTLFMGGSGVVAYIILWIVVPEAPFVSEVHSEAPPSGESSSAENTSQAYHDERKVYEEHIHKRKSLAGAVLIILGFLFLADNYFPHFYFHDFWPLILVAIGLALLLNSKK